VVGRDPVAVVQALWAADRAGDIDGVLATMHPDVTWSPLSRERKLYAGHAGVRRLHEEVYRTRGILTITVDDFMETETGNVIGRGQAMVRDDENVSVLNFEASYILRDGLIVSVETRHIDV
jgi:ketosteroid isomerase-like protein